MTLSLNCIVLGDDPDRTFTVEIPKNKNVSILKDLIKEKKAPHLDHIAASDLDLWQVSFPIDDLGTELGDINLARYRKLSPPSKELTTFFTDAAGGCLHVIAKAPAKMAVALDFTPFLSLNCFVLGDDPDRTFTVKIPKVENVSILKKLIKEEKAPHLDHISASDLDLWQVSFHIDDLHSKKQPPTVGPKLRSNNLLSDAFPSELDINHIHVVARPPGQGEYDIDSTWMLLIILSRTGRNSAASESLRLLQMVGNLKISSPDKRNPINTFHVIGPTVSPRHCR
ncbi:hypothetical protein K443DRAFT_135290 [Laccaria amethystina LaAM-08-1]|uniref:Crinkler effector protein N-terminal domain-containing protein n=1 Tax=Laccaria amethystina LaAM-08-1 TaxID=1095629 RepID=A0A0C9WI74_9AGAR|nr:hypothetical protein K443DRAFT_135290 [Laccaria amethystina LaAM-08-1]